MADAAAPPAPPAPVPVLHPTASPAPSGPERSADTLDISRSHDAGRVFDDWLSAYRGLEQADPGASWKELPPPRSEAEARARLCDAREENERCAGSGPWLVDVVFSQFYVASYLLARAPGRAPGGKLIAFGRIVSKEGGMMCFGWDQKSHIEPGARAHVVIEGVDSEPVWLHAAPPRPIVRGGSDGLLTPPWRRCACRDDTRDHCEEGCEEKCSSSSWTREDRFYDLVKAEEILTIRQHGEFEPGSESSNFHAPFAVVARAEGVLLVGGGAVKVVEWDR